MIWDYWLGIGPRCRVDYCSVLVRMREVRQEETAVIQAATHRERVARDGRVFEEEAPADTVQLETNGATC